MFVPASTTKLFTEASALDTLGADYRFQTPVYAKGDVDSSGHLKGDLILVASGDLTMGGRTTTDGKIAYSNGDHTYANYGFETILTPTDPLAGLKELARQNTWWQRHYYT
ncbi:D-Ala-D-Ala carboxypeptidase 3 (S13) family protein [uncultured archaeon]|nr:D-Ala-D-Ala carboxypeptidase 3 (S13) family protein [uncultured archaeon]